MQELGVQTHMPSNEIYNLA